MHDEQHERDCGAIDQEAFEKVIQENLSPEAVATIICLLEPARLQQPRTDRQRQGLLGAEWLADTLIELLGVDEHMRLMDELEL